jgi:energy-coupling factor transport system ATP-binding protein
MPIKYVDVSYTYSKKTPFSFEALKNINLKIEDGSFTAIVGRTGCGKTTLVQEMNGLLIPTSGAVYIDEFVVSANKKIRTKKIKPLRKHVGLVFQFPEYQLFQETVEKDVSFGPKNFGYKNEDALILAHKALNDVGLDESFYKRSPFELSGGEKRRVAIAGILALQTQVLVLDEPTAGLDPQGALEMMLLFKKLHESGLTIVLVTHDMNLVLEYCNRVIVMDNGEIKRVASPIELFTSSEELYSLEIPLLYRFVDILVKRGLKLNKNNIKDISSLAKEIKLAKERKNG